MHRRSILNNQKVPVLICFTYQNRDLNFAQYYQLGPPPPPPDQDLVPVYSLVE